MLTYIVVLAKYQLSCHPFLLHTLFRLICDSSAQGTAPPELSLELERLCVVQLTFALVVYGLEKAVTWEKTPESSSFRLRTAQSVAHVHPALSFGVTLLLGNLLLTGGTLHRPALLRHSALVTDVGGVSVLSLTL